MILEEDVQDVNRRLLLSNGQKITEKRLRILKIWGLLGVKIVGGNETEAPGFPMMDDERLERIKLAVYRIFKHADIRQTTLQGVYKAALMHRLKFTGGDPQQAVRLPCNEDVPDAHFQPIKDLANYPVVFIGTPIAKNNQNGK